MPAISLELAAPASWVPTLRAGRITLRQLRSEDLAAILRWDSQADLVRLYGGRPSELAFQTSGCAIGIEQAGRLIGLVGLSGETWAMRSAELRVLIADPTDRGQGFGREAVSAFLGHIRATTDLDFIYLRVLRGNEPAIRCYERCGFRRAGRLRVRQDHRYVSPPLADDLVLMVAEARGAGEAASRRS